MNSQLYRLLKQRVILCFAKLDSTLAVSANCEQRRRTIKEEENRFKVIRVSLLALIVLIVLPIKFCIFVQNIVQ